MMIPRVDTATHGVETPPPSLIADWLGLTSSQRATRVAPRDNVKVPPHTGKLKSQYSSIHLQFKHHGDENRVPSG